MLFMTLIMFMLVLPACNTMEDELNFSDEVRLKASLSSALSSVYTKGEGEIKSTHSEDLRTGLAKVIGEGNFDNAENSAFSATMSAPSAENLGLRDVAFDEFQGFPNATDSVHYVGWYPYQDAVYANPAGSGNTTVTFTVPDDAYTDILYSDVASGTRKSGFNTLTFRHALVKYSIKVYAMEVGENGELINDVWGKIKAVELEQMPSECIISLPESSGSLPVVSYSSENKSLRREAVLEKLPLGFSKAADLTYFLAPCPSDNILRLKITTEKDDVEVVTKQTLSIARDFQPGKHYQIYLRFTTHGVISAEIVAAQWIDNNDYLNVQHNSGVYYDLSENHTANTYIISSAYSYCFNATVRGNGYTGVMAVPGAPDDIYKVGNPVTAEIVWTDLVSGTDQNLDDFFKINPNVVDGRVFFNVIPVSATDSGLKKKGSVLVGVRDVDGNMLWTWHIWLTDRPLEQGYKNGFSVLDRDMGATAYNPADVTGTIAGFYYQWGRPTPLPLDKDVYKPEYNADGTWKSNSVVTFEKNGDIVPVIDRVKSPTHFFTQKATASDNTITKSLWGWRAEADEYAKTIYDPCPPGYRMPSKRLWRDLVILDQNNDKKHDATVVTSHNGVKAAEFKVDVNHVEVFYPMTGYYDLTTHQEYNEGAYMWAATFELGVLNNLEDDLPYGLDFVLKNGSELEEMQTVTKASYHAMPVRCISRMSKAHVTDLSDYQTANSYMVNDVGYYKFKATVRGNGVGQLVSPGTTSTIVLTEQLNTVDIKSQLVKVEPLWWHTYASAAPTEDKLDAGRHFAFLNDGKPDSDGYVSFKVDEFFEGNLVLAGRDAKNEIIWSWHIWFTDDPNMMKSNSFVVMDRNLGATHAPVSPSEPTGDELSQTYGLYYQWGRKDPFAVPGTSVYVYNGTEYELSASAFVAESDDSGVGRTVIHSVQNPMHFHKAPTDDTGVFNTNDIIGNFNITSTNNEANKQCFSNMTRPDDRQSLWGYSASSGYGVTTTKTMYDPCPPGYIVAHYLVWTNTERDSSSSKLYYSNLDGGFKSHGITGNKNAGIFLTNHSSRFDSAWFPYSGYIEGDSFTLKEQGNMGMGMFHTSTPAGNGARSLMYDDYYSGQGVSGNYWGMPSTFAYPVRCQKE